MIIFKRWKLNVYTALNTLLQLILGLGAKKRVFLPLTFNFSPAVKYAAKYYIHPFIFVIFSFLWQLRTSLSWYCPTFALGDFSKQPGSWCNLNQELAWARRDHFINKESFRLEPPDLKVLIFMFTFVTTEGWESWRCRTQKTGTLHPFGQTCFSFVCQTMTGLSVRPLHGPLGRAAAAA